MRLHLHIASFIRKKKKRNKNHQKNNKAMEEATVLRYLLAAEKFIVAEKQPQSYE